MKKKTSILDIAKALSISPTTISFILNGKAQEKRISEKLERSVLAYINEIGYKPNSLARSLRTGKTNTIGLVIESIANPFFANLARAIEDKAYKNGYRILYSSTANDVNRTGEILTMLAEQHVDGYIISPPAGVESHIQAVLDAKKPVVLFDRLLPSLQVDSVSIDNFNSTYQATLELLHEGYKSIGLITLDSNQTQMIDRRAGYIACVDNAGIPASVHEIAFEHIESESVESIASYLRNNPSLDAVLFSTNYLAISGLRAIRLLKYEIPDDLALVAFDDHDIFDLYSPSITAIAQPISEIADQLMNVLINKLNGKEKKTIVTSAMLPGKLIIRDSSKKINKI